MSFIQLHPIYTLEVTNIINFVVMYIYFYFQIKNILIFHEWVFMYFSVYVIGIFSIFEICIQNKIVINFCFSFIRMNRYTIV